MEMKEVNGGLPVVIAFIAGAIAGGMIYDLTNDPKGSVSEIRRGASDAYNLIVR